MMKDEAVWCKENDSNRILTATVEINRSVLKLNRLDRYSSNSVRGRLPQGALGT
jgi:hypothetical protein